MAGIGLEAVAVLLLLLPGFVSAAIIQSLCVRTSQTEFDKVIEALLYSFVVYVVFVAAFGAPPFRVIAEPIPGNGTLYSPDVDSTSLLWLLGISVAIGLAVSASSTNDIHGSVLRWARITQRTTRSSIWSDVFDEISYYVQIQFVDGRRIIGWPKYYSDTPDESSVFLENAAWIERDGHVIQIPGPGILITRNMPIESIKIGRAHV